MKILEKRSDIIKQNSISKSNKNSPLVKDPSNFKLSSFNQISLDSLIRSENNSIKNRTDDSISFNIPSKQESLNLTGRQIVDRINEKIKKDFPDADISFEPKDNTPERIANNIVSGVTALFSIYSDQNKELEGSDLLDSFMSKVKTGINRGYKDAVKILTVLGAMDQVGLKEELQKTMELVENGLNEFEALKRSEK